MNRCHFRKSSLLILAILALTGGSLFSHPVNWTRITATLLPTGDLEVDASIDLVYYLGSPEEYHRVSHLAMEDQRQRLADINADLQQGLWFYADGELLDLQLSTFDLPRDHIRDFQDYNTPNMALYEFDARVPPQARTLHFAADPLLRIELPIIFTLFYHGTRVEYTDWVNLGASTEDYVLPPRVSREELTERERRRQEAEGMTFDPDEMPERRSGWRIFRQFFDVGFVHIIPEGIDHVLFVLGLFFLRVHWKPLLIQITVFTVAHSITLFLVVLEMINIPERITEPLILLSVAYVAMENIFRKRLTVDRVVVVFFFGLLHGLGFGGSFAELGIQRGELFYTLLGFNIGVEAGHLAVLFAALLIFGWFRNFSWYRPYIAAIALFLVVQEVFL